jgi:predicted amidohydrolase
MDQWRDWAALDMDGPEYEALAALAQRHRCFLCVNAYELDRNFPDTYFQANVIFNDSGDVALRYRRLMSLHTPTPHDYWDKYLDLYGLDGTFPVARTSIGNLCAIASEEIQYPELVRAFALRGAEVICHPSAESLDLAVSGKDIAKRARAVENMAYVVSANVGGHVGAPFLEQSADGLSKVIDYQGRVLAEAGQGESIAAGSDVNVSALRRFRNRLGMNNFFSRHRMELYRAAYTSTDFHPPNTLVGRKPDRGFILEQQRGVLQRLLANGILEPDEE